MLVYDYIEGISLGDYYEEKRSIYKKLSKNQIKKILDYLFEMDKLFLFNQDYNPCNFIVKDEQIYFIDFNILFSINDSGEYISTYGSKRMEFCSNVQSCFNNFILRKKYSNYNYERLFTNVFWDFDSNLDFFEKGLLYEYIFIFRPFDNIAFEEKKLFNTYLELKSKYLLKRYKYFSNLYKKSGFEFPNVDKGLEIEKSLALVLKKPTEEIYNIEYFKLKNIKGYSLFFQENIKTFDLEKKYRYILENIAKILKSGNLDENILNYIDLHLEIWKILKNCKKN